MEDRPDDDATAAEIAAWMEQDFGEAVAEGIKQAGDQTNEAEDEET